MAESFSMTTIGPTCPPNRRAGFGSRRLWWALAIVASLYVEGCNFGRVSRIEIPPTSTNSDCDLISNVCGLPERYPLSFCSFRCSSQPPVFP
jgi:hypothetical protein